MEIMSHDEWMLRTFKGGPRSASLLRVDAALLAYERTRSAASLQTLDEAFMPWASDSPEEFDRFNGDEACAELFWMLRARMTAPARRER